MRKSPAVCKSYCVYDKNTGQITSSIFTEPSAVHMYTQHGEHLIESEDYGGGALHYVDVTQSPPVIKRRPVMSVTQDKTTITTGGADAVTLSGFPVPCDVTIGGERVGDIVIGGETYHVPDGELEWSTHMPAAYKITVRAFPYVNWEGEVTAISPSA